MKKNQILQIHGTDYENMTIRLLEAAMLTDELPDKEMKIGIKPNLVIADDASGGAVTHPEIVAGVIRYFQDHGYENLIVLEGSWVGADTDWAFRTSGIGEVCKRKGVKYINLQKDRYEMVNAAGMNMEICSEARNLDYLINLPVLKGHGQTLVTCALKNHKGLITNREKRHFHSMGLNRPIAHLSTVFADREFIVTDNICGDLDFEEGGNPVRMDRILCGKDPVLMDAYACNTMGYDIADVPYIQMAEKLGAGTSDLKNAEIVSLNKAKSGKMPRPTRRIASLAPSALPEDACSACYGSLIHALDKMSQNRRLSNFHEKIAIGQGYRGKTGSIGVGNCTSCFKKYCQGCPPSAADILDFLKKNWE